MKHLKNQFHISEQTILVPLQKYGLNLVVIPQPARSNNAPTKAKNQGSTGHKQNSEAQMYTEDLYEERGRAVSVQKTDLPLD